MRRLFFVLASVLGGCGSPTPPGPIEAPETVGASAVPTRTVLLARHPEYLEALSIPDQSRPTPVSEVVTLEGPWTSTSARAGVVQFQQAAPIRGIEWGFGRSTAPADVTLSDSGGRRVRWRYTRSEAEAVARTWDVSRGQLRIRGGADRAEPTGWTLHVPVWLDWSRRCSTGARTAVPRPLRFARWSTGG